MVWDTAPGNRVLGLSKVMNAGGHIWKGRVLSPFTGSFQRKRSGRFSFRSWPFNLQVEFHRGIRFVFAGAYEGGLIHLVHAQGAGHFEPIGATGLGCDRKYAG